MKKKQYKLLKKLEEYKNQNLLDNILPSRQIGNFCYLIAGLELLLSCNKFIQFINYSAEKKDIFALEVIKYINAKRTRDYNNLAMQMHNIEQIVFESFDQNESGIQEDSNIIFMYMEKNKEYSLIFDGFYYCFRNTELNTDKFYSIMTFIENPGLTCTQTLNRINIFGVYGVAYIIGNHYEVFQRIMRDNKTRFVPKNTHGLLPYKWKMLYIMCLSQEQQKIKDLIFGN